MARILNLLSPSRNAATGGPTAGDNGIENEHFSADRSGLFHPFRLVALTLAGFSVQDLLKNFNEPDGVSGLNQITISAQIARSVGIALHG